MDETKETSILVVVHGGYGEPMVSAAEAIVGPLDLAISTICPQTSPDHVRQRITSEIARLDRGGGVLVLTDLCGSTPANVCQLVVEGQSGCEVLCGLNLAMLVKLSTCSRRQGAHQLAQELWGTSRRSIIVGKPERQG